MNVSTDLLVIGGGIAGLTTALAASEHGLNVIVVDSPRVGAASRAAAGLLAPSLEGMPSAARAVAMEARDFYPRFLERLRARADMVVSLDRSGILELASSREERQTLFGNAPSEAQQLNEESLASLEPAFAGHAGALLHPDDGAVDNVALMSALDLAIAREPRIERLTDSVAALDFSRHEPRTRTAAGLEFTSASVLLASGAWASGVNGLPRRLPVRPLRGQILRLDAAPIYHVTYAHGGYLVPRGRSLLVGATSEDAGFTSATTAEGLASMRSVARRAIPSLDSAQVMEHWAGLRPVTPDGLPILGRDPDHPALVYACGFSRNGILLGPWAAGRLADLLVGEKPHDAIAIFSAARFDQVS